jgi:hypothetical protein
MYGKISLNQKAFFNKQNFVWKKTVNLPVYVVQGILFCMCLSVLNGSYSHFP